MSPESRSIPTSVSLPPPTFPSMTNSPSFPSKTGKSDPVLHLHSEQPLLTQEYLVHEREKTEPYDGRDVHPERRRDGSPQKTQEGFRRPNDDIERHLVDVRGWVPREDYAAKLFVFPISRR